MSKHIVVYSHGFGVRKDDRGLFTDIAAVIPDAEHIMFDYNSADDAQNTLTVTPLTKQTMRLAQVLNETKAKYPDAQIDLICHSQGCVVAAMLHPKGIRKVVFITPPSSLSVERMLKLFGEREGAVVDVKGLTSFPRRDGSTTIVPSEYWQSVEDIDPIALYNQFAEQTSLTVVSVEQDEVLGSTDFSNITSAVKIITLNASHDFTGDARRVLTETIKSELGDEPI